MPSCSSPLSLLLYFVGLSLPLNCRVELAQTIAVPEFDLLVYLQVFGLALLLEAPFYWACVRARGWRAFLSAWFFCNLSTHPLVFFGFPLLFSRMGSVYSTYLFWSELFALVVEALLLHFVWRQSLLRAFVFSAAANLFSWWVGLYLV